MAEAVICYVNNYDLSILIENTVHSVVCYNLTATLS
jgi:hypothetical protein